MISASSFQGKSVAVFGLARSGRLAAEALAAAGANVRAWDDRAERREELGGRAIHMVDLARDPWPPTDALVLSPGVPLTHPEPHAVVQRALEAGAEIIGDIEVFLRNRPASKLVGITGTNGKSTTTALIAHILERAGVAAAMGGNIGRPVLDLPALPADGVYVLEVSSYQIDLTPSWRADVAVLLNITPDHLDRHGGMANYIAIKKRIFGGQTSEDVAIVGIDDEATAAIADELSHRPAGRVVRIAVGREVAGGVYALDGHLIDGRGDPATTIVALKALERLAGAHNWQNAAAAAAACLALGLDRAAVADGLESFPGLAHRMELAGELAGVRFVNDSKATNADAAARALSSYDEIYWIAGGQAKEGGISSLLARLANVRRAYLIGEAAGDFAAALGGRVPVAESGTIDRAVAEAYRDAAEAVAAGRAARPVVLLSPACASFDQFSDFEARGEAFKAAVAALGAGGGA
jgi:UDP-N-acetylmuramoylalanine--D-glutamate ligase